MTTKQFSWHQVRWNKFLSQFDFIVKVIPGKDNDKPDSFTWWSQDLPQDKDNTRVQFQYQVLLKSDNLSFE
jgi:hypothetical protein